MSTDSVLVSRRQCYQNLAEKCRRANTRIPCTHNVTNRRRRAYACSPCKCDLFLFGAPLAATKPFVLPRIKSRVHAEVLRKIVRVCESVFVPLPSAAPPLPVPFAHSLSLTFLPAPVLFEGNWQLGRNPFVDGALHARQSKQLRMPFQ